MTSATSHEAFEVNLADEALYAEREPHEIWRILRTQDPVHWNPGWDGFPGFWSITKHSDIVAISRDPRTFTSVLGHHLVSDPAHPERDSDHGMRGRTLIDIDPPLHPKLRNLIGKGFTPRQIALLEPSVREVVRGIYDSVAPLGECDFVADVAGRLPLEVIGGMLGIPQEDWPIAFELSTGEGELIDGKRDPMATRNRRNAAFDYFAGLIAQRRVNPQPDLVTLLTATEVEGEPLAEDDLLALCWFLNAAGNETTRSTAAGALLTLLDHPDERARLESDPSLLPTAVEEILRWWTPVRHMVRFATRDTEIRGQQIRAGEKVALWYSSANRDEEVFEDPYRFDVGRKRNDHLSFGVGEHFCLGASLARLELRLLLEPMFQRLPNIELAGPPERVWSTELASTKRLPVRYTPQ